MADGLSWIGGGLAFLFFTHWAIQGLKQWQSERHTELTSTDNEVASVGNGAQQSDEQGLALWHRRGLL